jgi:hypothetical protein
MTSGSSGLFDHLQVKRASAHRIDPERCQCGKRQVKRTQRRKRNLASRTGLATRRSKFYADRLAGLTLDPALNGFAHQSGHKPKARFPRCAQRSERLAQEASLLARASLCRGAFRRSWPVQCRRRQATGTQRGDTCRVIRAGLRARDIGVGRHSHLGGWLPLGPRHPEVGATGEEHWKDKWQQPSHMRTVARPAWSGNCDLVACSTHD